MKVCRNLNIASRKVGVLPNRNSSSLLTNSTSLNQDGPSIPRSSKSNHLIIIEQKRKLKIYFTTAWESWPPSYQMLRKRRNSSKKIRLKPWSCTTSSIFPLQSNNASRICRWTWSSCWSSKSKIKSSNTVSSTPSLAKKRFWNWAKISGNLNLDSKIWRSGKLSKIKSKRSSLPKQWCSAKKNHRCPRG